MNKKLIEYIDNSIRRKIKESNIFYNKVQPDTDVYRLFGNDINYHLEKIFEDTDGKTFRLYIKNLTAIYPKKNDYFETDNFYYYKVCDIPEVYYYINKKYDFIDTPFQDNNEAIDDINQFSNEIGKPYTQIVVNGSTGHAIDSKLFKDIIKEKFPYLKFKLDKFNNITANDVVPPKGQDFEKIKLPSELPDPIKINKNDLIAESKKKSKNLINEEITL